MNNDSRPLEMGVDAIEVLEKRKEEAIGEKPLRRALGE
jgi:hypothetical protein